MAFKKEIKHMLANNQINYALNIPKSLKYLRLGLQWPYVHLDRNLLYSQPCISMIYYCKYDG